MSHSSQQSSQNKRQRKNHHQPLDLEALVENVGIGIIQPNTQDDIDPTIAPYPDLAMNCFPTESIAITNHAACIGDTPSSMGSSYHSMPSHHNNLVSPCQSNQRAIDWYNEAKRTSELLQINKTVKFNLFRYWKFSDKDLDWNFDRDKTTICGFMLDQINVVNDELQWWVEHKKRIKIVHTTHRNNCIKNIQVKFKGKSFWVCHIYFNMFLIIYFFRNV